MLFCLPYLSPVAHKRDIGDPDQTPQNAASDQKLHSLLLIHEFLQNTITGKSSVGNGSVQGVEIKESSRYKWVKDTFFSFFG